MQPTRATLAIWFTLCFLSWILNCLWLAKGFFFFFLGRAYKDIEEAACAGAALQGCCMFFTCSFHTLLLQPLHCYCSASEPEDKAPCTLFDSNTTDSRGLLSFFPSADKNTFLNLMRFGFQGCLYSSPAWCKRAVCALVYTLAGEPLLRAPRMREVPKYFAAREWERGFSDLYKSGAEWVRRARVWIAPRLIAACQIFFLSFLTQTPKKGPFTKSLNSTEVVKLVLLFMRLRKKRVLEV